MIEFLRGKVTPKDWAINGAVVALTVLIFGAFTFLIIVPRRTTVSEIAAKIDQTKTALRKAEDTDKNIGKLQNDAEEMQRLVDQFEQRLPKEQEIPALLQTFESYASELGLRPELVPRQSVDDKRKQTIPYQVTVHGGFHDIVTFINKLERHKRYVKISELNIGEQEEGVSQAKFILSTYRFKEAAPEKAEEAPKAPAKEKAQK